MLLTALNVLLRYGFEISTLSLFGLTLHATLINETVIYLHCGLFMLASAMTLAENDHVRVDVLYNRFSPKTQSLVDIVGHLFLLWPMCALIVWSSWGFVETSFQNQERSVEAQGLPYVFLLKAMLPIMGGLLLLQSMAQIVLAVQQLRSAPSTEGVNS